MFYIILGIVALCIGIWVLSIVLGIIVAIFEFIEKHKICSFITLSIVGGAIYYINAERPFVFLVDWWKEIKNFIWNITYKHTLFDTIWIYGVIILLSLSVSSILLSVFRTEWLKIFVCTLISILSVIMVVMTEQNYLSVILISVTILGIVYLWAYSIKVSQKIGFVKDTNETFIVLEKLLVTMSLIIIISLSGIIDFANNYFSVSISKFVIPIAFNVYFMFEIIVKTSAIFKGYKHINGFVKANDVFSYRELVGHAVFNNLTDRNEYIYSVLSIMKRKKRIYDFPLVQGWYFGRELYKTFEKAIKANHSSDEIKTKLRCDLREFKFDTVYKYFYSTIKGFDIDFVENEEDIKRKKSETGVGAIEFVMMRYPLKNHPILLENIDIRTKYVTALDSFVRRSKIDEKKWEAKLADYFKEFEIEALEEDKGRAINCFSKMVVRKDGLLKKIKSNYSYLLLLESIYFENLLTDEAISYKEIESTFDVLKIKVKYRDFIYQYVKRMFIERDVASAENLLQTVLKSNVKRTLEHVHYNIMWNEQYVRAKQYKVAVCATMSAGKSTFVNSMLGSDYIPAKNEACTAKVTTIRDNDNLENIIGCYTRNDNSKEYSNIIDADVLSSWNEDTDVKETILEGNIEEVSCNAGVLVVHDTPGTNNSEDITHHDITIDFLKNKELDLIIYLINAEYISTTDTEILLKEIQQIASQNNTKIVFGLNKIDVYDEEGCENVANVIKNLEKQIEEYGFVKPIIFPFSANAARLFKLALKGRELTKREKRTFRNLYEYFLKFNASDYIVNASVENISEYYLNNKSKNDIMIDGEKYEYCQLMNALKNTGILSVESWLEKQIDDML